MNDMRLDLSEKPINRKKSEWVLEGVDGSAEESHKMRGPRRAFRLFIENPPPPAEEDRREALGGEVPQGIQRVSRRASDDFFPPLPDYS